jgi:D-lactate dehydrogenase
MRVAVFSTKPYDRAFLSDANAEDGHRLRFLEARLSHETVSLAAGEEAVCAFVNDDLGAANLEALAKSGVRIVALRSAGFNNVDLAAAKAFGLTIARVPAYSPHAVAEHTIALILTLNRQIHRAYNRVREGNFALDGLLGFDLCGKTAGVMGTGKIGEVVVRILTGSAAESWRMTRGPIRPARPWARLREPGRADRVERHHNAPLPAHALRPTT